MIWKKRLVADFSPFPYKVPYMAKIFNSIRLIVFSLLDPNSLLVIVINCASVVMEIFYISALSHSLSLSLSFANGVCWTADAVIRPDLLYLILSGLEAVCGASQLMLYVFYYILIYVPDSDSLFYYIGRFARIIWQELMKLCR
ncbi:bidirectional sugar transporter SWEET4-like [Tasmannia lanceolata]|uniref:bidirectional sugar transporter SWEET4-like n=1 Tax=Tasmannia lanceolata TaxID=3420 RepID=UPI004063EA36